MGSWSFLNPRNWFRRRDGLPPRTRADLYGGAARLVAEVEGIGPHHRRQLARLGIHDTDQLLAYPAAAVAAAIDTPEKRVRTWQAAAELAAVDGIGPHDARTLARGGVDGIRDLVARDARDLAEHVNGHLAALGTRAGGRVSATRVWAWQQAARTMKRRRVRVRLSEGAHGSGRGRGGGRAPSVSGSAVKMRPAARAPEAATRVRSTASGRSNGPCAAVTAAGSPCRRAARADSRFCASHRGQRVPAGGADGAGEARTAPEAGGSTASAKRRPGAARRVHVTQNGYRLYRKGNRYYFSKKPPTELARDGAEPVYELPPDREVKVTQNGLPVLKSK